MRIISFIIVVISFLFFSCNQLNKRKSPTSSIQFENIGNVISGNYQIISGDGNEVVVKQGVNFGMIDSKKKIVIPLQFDSIYHPHLQNYLFVEKNKVAGVIRFTGEVIIPFEYQSINQTYYNNFTGIDTFIVQKNGKLGTVDFKNNVVIPIIYDGISGWVEYGPDAHYVKKDGLYGILAHNGSTLIPPIYDEVYYCSDEIITVKKNNKEGIVNIKNQVLLPCIYDVILLDIDWWGFLTKNKKKEKIVVRKDNRWTYLNLEGGVIKDNVPYKEIKEEHEITSNTDPFAAIDSYMIFNEKEKNKHIISH